MGIIYPTTDKDPLGHHRLYCHALWDQGDHHAAVCQCPPGTLLDSPRSAALPAPEWGGLPCPQGLVCLCRSGQVCPYNRSDWLLCRLKVILESELESPNPIMIGFGVRVEI